MTCPSCSTEYDDADRFTFCPHARLKPEEDAARHARAVALMGQSIRFAHQPEGPDRRIQAIAWNGMVTIAGMAGEFSPDLFIVVTAKHSPDPVAGHKTCRRGIALTAASQAADATAELVRFAREGDNIPPPFGETEVVELLADALKMAMEVEHFDDPDAADDERNQLYGALTKFLDGWAG